MDSIVSSPVVTRLTWRGMGRGVASLSFVAADKIIEPFRSAGDANLRSNWDLYREADGAHEASETRYLG